MDKEKPTSESPDAEHPALLLSGIVSRSKEHEGRVCI